MFQGSLMSDNRHFKSSESEAVTNAEPSRLANLQSIYQLVFLSWQKAICSVKSTIVYRREVSLISNRLPF